MAPPPPSLADELKSLRIDRAPARRGLPGWVVPALVVAALVAVALVAWRAVGDRLFAPEVETSTVALVTPAQSAQLLVATGYVVPQRKANISPRIGGRVDRLLVEGGRMATAGQTSAPRPGAPYKAPLLHGPASTHRA